MREKVYPHSYRVVITDLSGGLEKAFEIYVPAFNVRLFGNTVEKALKNYMEFFDKEIRQRKKQKIPMPLPDFKPDTIKRVLLRIPTRLYEKIMELAKKEGKSFNRFVVTLLEKYLKN